MDQVRVNHKFQLNQQILGLIKKSPLSNIKTLWSSKDSMESKTEYSQLSQSDQELLKKFIYTEDDRTIMSRVKCASCIIDQCKHCKMLQNPFNSNLSPEFHQIWKNTHLIKNGENFAVMTGYTYKNNPYVIFSSQNSDYLKIKDKTLK